MTDISRYAPATAFRSKQSLDPHNGILMDNEFSAIQLSIDAIIRRLDLLQRDDGKLKNGAVHSDSFDGTSLSLLSGGWSPRGNWETGTSYQATDVVVEAGRTYVCLSGHLAGSFATDRMSGYWRAIDPEISSANRSAIINGGFNIWQRGVSGFTTGPNADRWRYDTNTDDTVTFAREMFAPGQSAVPGEPAYFLRASLTAGAAGGLNDFRQRVEDVRTFAGETVTLSYWIKGTGDAVITNRRLAQNFGSGGSAQVSIALPDVSVTAQWRKIVETVALPSIAGKTIGADSFLDIVLSLPVHQTVDIDIAQVQLERGDTATVFERKPIGVELGECQRFTLVHAADSYNDFFGMGMCSGPSRAWVGVHFPVQMRAVPTMSITTSAHFGLWLPTTAVEICSSVTLNNASVHGGRLDCQTGTSNLNFGYSTHLVAADASARIVLDAEL